MQARPYMSDEFLAIYLNDHLAGTLVAVELLQHLERTYAGHAVEQFATALRSDIEEIASSGVSLMPEGLEKNIPVADMADLISFLKNWRYLDGATPLGKE